MREDLLKKRCDVLKTIAPICAAFKIDDYDYVVLEENDIFHETLRICDIQIGCSENSIEAIVDELIGYLFITKFCKHRNIGTFQSKMINAIKKYWLQDDEMPRHIDTDRLALKLATESPFQPVLKSDDKDFVNFELRGG